MVTTGGRETAPTPSSPASFDGRGVLRQLLFEGDDGSLSAEVASHFGGEIGIQRLVDGGENAARQQASDQILRANLQLLRQVLHADAFRNRDGASDGQRLGRKRETRRRNKALHRAFLHATRNVTLTGTRGTSHGASCRRRRSSDAGTAREPGTRSWRVQNEWDADRGARRDAVAGRGAPVGGAPGRGRWKIGLPRSGITSREAAALAAGRAGAE